MPNTLLDITPATHPLDDAIVAAEEYDSRTLSGYVRLNEERRAILADITERGGIYG